MGSKHTRANSNQPHLKPEAPFLPTESSDADLVFSTLDSRHLRSRRDGTHVSVHSIRTAFASPKDINVTNARRRQRASLPELLVPKRKDSILSVATSSHTEHSHPQITHTKSEFISPMRILLKKQAAHENTEKAEFEEEADTPAFVRNFKEKEGKEAPKSTYKLLKPRNQSTAAAAEAESSTQMDGIISFLKEAASVKYELQQKASPLSFTSLLKPPSARGASTSSPMAAGAGKYRIKNLLNLNLVNMHAGNGPLPKRQVLRVWRGKRGSMLVES